MMYQGLSVQGARNVLIDWSNKLSKTNNNVSERMLEEAIDIVIAELDKYSWIPIKRRPLTEEERESILEYYGANYEFTSNECVFDCRMPEDGQKILISTSWGVSIDVCEYDCTGEGLNLYSLEEYGDWDDVTAWMPLPEPYKEAEQ